MSSGESLPGLGHQVLPGLLAIVERARTHEQHELAQPGARPEVVHAARVETLFALRDYARAIEALSWPVPRSIMLDLRLHQALVGFVPNR